MGVAAMLAVIRRTGAIRNTMELRYKLPAVVHLGLIVLMDGGRDRPSRWYTAIERVASICNTANGAILRNLAFVRHCVTVIGHAREHGRLASDCPDNCTTVGRGCARSAFVIGVV